MLPQNLRRWADSKKARRKSKRQKRTRRLESLEQRLVLDSTMTFNEIMFNPATTDESLEWIELYNQMSVNLDVSGWSISGGVGFQFPEGTIIGGREHLLVAADPVAFQTETGISGALGPYSGSLSNNGELLELHNNSDRLMDTVDYGDNYPWPVAADGSGATLAKLSGGGLSGDAESWTFSPQVGGTPGETNFVNEVQQVRQESLVQFDDVWTYSDTGNDPGAGWQDPGFDTATWEQGPGLFYSGDVTVPPDVTASSALVGYWTFDNTLQDGSTYGNHGQLLGGAFDVDVPTEIGVGRSLEIQAGDGGVSVAAATELNSNVFTLAYWVKDPGQVNGSNSSNGETGHNRVTSRSGDSYETAINNTAAGGGSSRLKYHSAGVGWRDTPFQFAINDWTHIAHSYDGTELSVYADGSLVHTETVAINPSGGLFLGARHNATESFVGNLDDAALWNTSLSGDQIRALATGDATPVTLVLPQPVTIESNTADWTQSTVSIDGDPAGVWDPTGDPAPPAANTFTLTPVAVSQALVPHIDNAGQTIGVTGLVGDNNVRYYRTTFDLGPFDVVSGSLQIAADNGAQVYINGTLLATETSFDVANWAAPLPSLTFANNGSVTSTKFETAVSNYTGWIEGTNEIIVALRNPSNEANPAGGFAFSMSVVPGVTAAGDGLLGYWPLEETVGTNVPNSVVGGVNGTINNGVAWVNDGTRGQALNFDGVDGFVAAGVLPALEIEDDFTWSFWSRQEQAAPPSRPNDVILGNRLPDSGWVKFTPSALEYRNVTQPTFINNVDYANISPALGWVHHAAVKDGNTLTYYRDGVVGGSSTITADMPSIPFYFGGDQTVENWDGLLDDIAVWERALPASSIAGLADESLTPLTAPTGGVAIIDPPEQTLFSLPPFEDDFAADTLSPATFEVIEHGLENQGAGTAPNFTVETVSNSDQLTISGTASVNFWGGQSIRTVDTFDSSLTTTISVDRVSLNGTGTAYRSSLWLYANAGNYLHFSQNVGENGWQYNASNTNGTGTSNPTGGGNNMTVFDSLDGSTGLHEMKLEVTPSGDGSITVEMYLDDQFGGSHTLTNFPSDFQVILTGQGRAINDTVTAVFDNLNIDQQLENRFRTEVDFGAQPETSYFRQEFQFDGAADLTTLTLTPIVDDGAVFYLNGTEIHRQNISAGPIVHSTPATAEVDGLQLSSAVVLPGDNLVVGNNVLSVSLHQAAGSTDSYFGAELKATILPASASVDSFLRFNEIPSTTDAAFWIEIHNATDGSISTAGYQISSNNELVTPYDIPAQSIPVGSYLVITEVDLGFHPVANEQLYLTAFNGATVADGVEVEVVAQARSEDHDGRWLRPDAATLGAANTFSIESDIVINEIMINELATQRRWVEIYNRGGSAINLEGWSFTDGINYTFDAGEMIGSGDYIVVTDDRDGLLIQHPGIDAVGNFTGQLSRDGERLELSDAVGNPVDVVDYHTRGRWPFEADGWGSSIELRDPFADNSLPESWAPSDNSQNTNWQTITYSGLGTNSNAPTRYHELVLGMLDAGVVLLDDIVVVEDPNGAARTIIQNGDFEADSPNTVPAAWRVLGTHGGSEVIVDPDDPNNQVLRLTAIGSTEHMHNHLETTLKDGASFITLSNNTEYEISFRARWVSGSNQLNSRLYFNRLQRTTLLDIPNDNGTPGAENSRIEANIGPTYTEFGHSPPVPAVNQDVIVSVTAEDANGVANVTLYYSVDSGAFQTVAMQNVDGDLYQATIPGQSASAIVQFYVEGEDGLNAISTFPATGAESRALYKVEDGQALNLDLVNNFRIIMTTPDSDWLHTETNVMSNAPIGATVIYNESEVFYNVGARLKGSERGRSQNVRVGFVVTFDQMQLFRGVHRSVAVDRSGAGNQFSQKEILVRHTLNHAGDIPGSNDDIIHVIAPRSAHTSSALLQMARLGDVFLDGQYQNGSDGPAFEYELIYYPTSTVGNDPEGLKRPQPDSVTGVSLTDLGSDKERYRFNFIKENNRREDDYSTIIPVLQALGQPTSAQFHEQTAELLDIDQWLRAFAVQRLWGIGDSYSSNSQHNAQFYIRPSDGKALYFPWDMDFTASSGATSGFTNNSDLQQFLNLPANVHHYYGHIHDIVTHSYNSAYMDQWVQHYSSLLPAEDLSGFSSYLATRSNHASNTINGAVSQVNFGITTNGGQVVNDSSIQLNGNGWVNVREIRVAGSSFPLSLDWPTNNTWTTLMPLEFGANDIVLEAYDFRGNLIGTDTISLESTVANPVREFLRISEVNYHPHDPSVAEIAAGFTDDDDFEFIEFVNTSPTTTLNLTNVQVVDGVEFTFPDNTMLGPNERIVIVRDLAAFEERYGVGINVAGVYDGRLSNSGELIRVINDEGGVVVEFEYNDAGNWPSRADGNASSLDIIDPTASPADSDNWRSSRDYAGSPGTEGLGDFADVVINEVLSHTDLPSVDSIELLNTGGQMLNIGNWVLSDSNNNYFKFPVPANTMLDTGEYIVFDETDFNPTPLNPGPNDFALNGAHGDNLWLLEMVGGEPTRFADSVTFGAQANGESWGRWLNGTGRLYPMIEVTLNAENTGPRVGPVVINEVMYAPIDPDGVGPIEAANLEYVEIFNPTNSDVVMTNWQLDGGINFEFPAAFSLPAGQAVAVLPFDPADGANATLLADFLSAYPGAAALTLIGGYGGQLNNAGDRVTLLRPDSPPLDEPNFIPLLLEDEVRYDDAAPWPTAADGGGPSLNRTGEDDWGNDAANWFTTGGTPGFFDSVATTVVDVLVNADQIDPAPLPSGPSPTSWQLQQSDIRSIQVEFSRPVNVALAPADLVLTNLGVNAPVDADVVVPLNAGHLSIDGLVLTLTFGNYELDEGVYQLEVLNTATDALGDPVQPFTIDGDDTNRLAKLNAEWSGDDGVSVFDFTTFSYWFGQSVGIAPAYVDISGDGGVSVFDFTGFSTNFGTPLIFPVGFAAANVVPFIEVDNSQNGIEVQPSQVQLDPFTDNRIVENRIAENAVVDNGARRPSREELKLEVFAQMEQEDLDSVLEQFAGDIAERWLDQ
jgi:hypothetical protein